MAVPGCAAAAGRSMAVVRRSPVSPAARTTPTATMPPRRPKIQVAAAAATEIASRRAAGPSGASASPATTHPIASCGRRFRASARSSASGIVRRARSRRNRVLQGLEALLADARDLLQLVDGPEAAVLLAVVDDPLRERRADAVQLLELRLCRSGEADPGSRSAR